MAPGIAHIVDLLIRIISAQRQAFGAHAANSLHADVGKSFRLDVNSQ